jgi:hypothetical protein
MLALIAAVLIATATPQPTALPRIDLTKIQSPSLLPKKKLHAEYVVEVNKLGQVARVRSVKKSGSVTFDSQTYGNALQAFIRTPDNHVVLGTYRLFYDYDPKTHRVRRDVALISRGGVNPNAKGAVDDMMAKEKAAEAAGVRRTGVTPAPHPAPKVHIATPAPHG